MDSTYFKVLGKNEELFSPIRVSELKGWETIFREMSNTYIYNIQYNLSWLAQ